MAKNNEDKNAKSEKFRLPMSMPGVKPEDYDSPGAHGSANIPKTKEEQKKRKQVPLHDEEIGGG